MDNLPYVLLPDLEYDRDEIMKLVNDKRMPWQRFDGYSNHTDNFAHEHRYWATNENTWYFKKSDEYIFKNEEVCKLMDQISIETEIDRIRLTMFMPQTVMHMHVDNGRNAALLMPITNDDRPLFLKGYDGTIHEIVYNVPILFDCPREHGLLVKGDKRINLQFSYYDDFQSMKKMYLDGNLIKGQK